MITEDSFKEIALGFPGAESTKHFDRIGFKVIGKRMFATFWAQNNTANLFLTPGEQEIFCEKDKENIYPVPNKWGEKGATTFELDMVSKDVLQEALVAAYQRVVTPK